jgi:hypothetical protein
MKCDQQDERIRGLHLVSNGAGSGPGRSFDLEMTHEAGVRRTRRTRTGRIVRLAGPVLILVAGLVAGVWLMLSGLHERSLVQPVPGGQTAIGHIVDYKVHSYEGRSYAAIVQYEAADGQAVTITAPWTAHKPVIGSAATVSYPLLDPWHGHDLSVPGWTWQWPFLTGILFNLLVAALFAHAAVNTVRFARAMRTEGGAAAAAIANRAMMQVLHAGRVFQIVALPGLAAIVFYTVYENTGRVSAGLIAVAILAAFVAALFWLRPATRRRPRE